jgi:hypothetical protein
MYFRFLGAFAKLRKATVSVVMCVCVCVCPTARGTLASPGRNVMRFYTLEVFANLLTRFKFHYSLTVLMGTVHEDVRAFIVTYCNVL